MNKFAPLSEGEDVAFLVRWRGRQEGPYSASVIDAKLAANEIGLLHEILHAGKWVTIREYVAEREATLRAAQHAREEQKRQTREEADLQARDREEQHRLATLAEERRKNDLLAASIERQNSPSSPVTGQRTFLKPGRSGSILALALIGLFIFGPLCIAAWVMGNADLREMDVGIMDSNERSSTRTGRDVGILGTILWIIAVIFIFSIH